jgi:hypothetical protein
MGMKQPVRLVKESVDVSARSAELVGRFDSMFDNNSKFD